jgi:hypothetical protein
MADDEVGPVEPLGVREGIEGGRLQLRVGFAQRRLHVREAVLGRQPLDQGKGVLDAHES